MPGRIAVMASDLWIEQPSLHFKHDQEDQLKKTLDLDRHLILSPINLPQDVVLDVEANVGMTFGSGAKKYKLTRWAFFQLCQLVCPSLYGFITDLAGVHRDKDSQREDYSFSEALEILNRTIRRRFHNRIRGKVALIDMARNTIDGFVSASYKWLPNYELYDRTNAAMDQAKDAAFLEAILVGRWMLIRYVEKKPFLSFEHDGIDERFFSGFHFSNNEVGRASVKAATMLYRKFSKSASISPISGRDEHVRHAGMKFEVRFEQLVRSLFSKSFEAAKCLANIGMLQDIHLGLGNKSARHEEKRLDDIASRLVRKGVPLTIAKSVVANMARQGSYDEQPVEPILYRPKERTAYDLYNALGRCAVTLPINHRERAEQTAHAILLGKVAFD